MRWVYYNTHSNIGLVVQWIVQKFPELLIQVRFLARSQKGNYVFRSF